MYVVSGITGQTGHHVAKELVRLGKRVVGLSRRPPSEVEGAPEGVELRQLDLADTDALIALLADAKGFYGLVPPNWAADDYLGSAATVGASIARAVKHVPRAVLLSSIAVQVPEGTGPIRALRPMEEGAKGHATFLRAAYFAENLASFGDAMREGTLPTYWDPAKSIAIVSVADIGARAAALLVAEQAPEVVQLTGPEDHTFAEVAQTAGALLGREVANLQLPSDAIRGPLREMGAGQIADLYAEMNEGMAQDRIVFDPSYPVERGTRSLRESLGAILGVG